MQAQLSSERVLASGSAYQSATVSGPVMVKVLAVALGVGLADGEGDGEATAAAATAVAGIVTWAEGGEAGPRQSCSVGVTV